jgi:hypothetical protein
MVSTLAWGAQNHVLGEKQKRLTHGSTRMDEPELDPLYLGKRLSFWLKCIQDRDENNMETAFDAIRELGPDAWIAVPELTRIVAEPYDPILIGLDDDRLILSKMQNIQLRADAIDGLAAIGEAAAPASAALIRWALATRVIPQNILSEDDDAFFVDLVTVDVLERMRVAGAVSQFGPAAAPTVVELLKSSNGEGRKLAVAILSEGTLLIAGDLLKSWNCDDRILGIAILSDMWPVVPREHLSELQNLSMCAAN